MSYKAGIAAAIADMKERNGSSLISIKKWMQSKLPADKKWLNAQFLQALKSAVLAGELVKVKVQCCNKHLQLLYDFESHINYRRSLFYFVEYHVCTQCK